MRACVIAAAIVASHPTGLRGKDPQEDASSSVSHAIIAPLSQQRMRGRGAHRAIALRPLFATRGRRSAPTIQRRRSCGRTRPTAVLAEPGATAPQPSGPNLGWTAHGRRAAARARNTALDGMIARHAAANGLPVELVHRVVKRESGYNPRASSRGNIGLMQIRHGTARGIGYSGSASGLLDPETNLTYAVRYLAGAYRAAGGNASRAVSLLRERLSRRGARRRPALQQAVAWSPPAWETQPVAMHDTDGATDRPRAGGIPGGTDAGPGPLRQ